MRLVTTVIVAALLIVTTTPPAADAAPDDKPVLLGLATQDWQTELPQFEQEAGRMPAFRQVFWNFGLDWDAPGIRLVLDSHHDWGITTWQVIHTDDLDAFNAGALDTNLDQMVAMYRAWMGGDETKRLVIAPFPEANLTSHPWSGDPDGFKTAYHRIVDAFRDGGLGPDRVRFAWVMNGVSSKGFEYEQFYPGDDVVDLLSFNKLNRNIEIADEPAWRDYEETFGRHLEEMSQRVSSTKPIFINQTGSVDSQGRRAGWLSDMFDGLLAHPQVVGATYFNRLKEEGDNLNDFRVLVDGQLDPAFDAGYMTWSGPDETSWIFDGRMDEWVRHNEESAPGGFVDVVPGSTFADDIARLAEAGVTKGCNPPENNLFCPDQPVTRAQMAAFLVRAFDYGPAPNNPFVDSAGSTFADDIARLAEAGVTKGCNPPENDLFCPDQPVTRAQMAAFLVRSAGL